MDNTPGHRAFRKDRAQLGQRSLADVEVLLRDTNRALDPHLADDRPEAAAPRMEAEAIAVEVARKGGILAALRSSPLVGADLDLARIRHEGRKIDL